jgi:hypothetical protein
MDRFALPSIPEPLTSELIGSWMGDSAVCSPRLGWLHRRDAVFVPVSKGSALSHSMTITAFSGDDQVPLAARRGDRSLVFSDPSSRT